MIVYLKANVYISYKAKTAVINNFKMYLIIDRHYKPSTIKNYMYEIEIFYNYINSKSIIVNFEGFLIVKYLQKLINKF